MTTTPAATFIHTLAEWETRELPGLSLSAADRALAEKLTAGNGNRVVIDELRSGVRIAVRSWVGVIRFSSFELRIVPKLAGDHVGLIQMIDFASGLDCLNRYRSMQDIESGSNSLLDLIALLHAEACETIAKNGLLAGYQEVEEDLPLVRGRILVANQYLKRYGLMNRVECRYDEQTTDIVENQLLLAALLASARRVTHPAVAARIRRLLGIFSSACSLDDLNLNETRNTLVYHRLNEHYRTAHGLAWLLLDGLGVRDLLRGGDRECFAFLLNMNHLFERFVDRWLQTILSCTGLRVASQERANTILWDADAGQPYAHVRPDILVRSSTNGHVLPLDAKYKLYDEKELALGDVYQAFLYAFAWSGPPHAAILVHPSSSCSPAQVRLQVRNQMGSVGAELLAIGVQIPTALAEAQSGPNGPMSTTMREAIIKHLNTAA